MGAYQAVMDIGTNTCRLIVAERTDGGDTTHLRQLRVTRIGEGLGRGNLHISRAAMDRTLAALTEYKAMIAGYPVEKTTLFGTQALREADNAAAFAVEVKDRTGFDLEIISGDREAYLSYTGAVSGLKGLGLSSPLVLDIGGGSTELFWEEARPGGEGRATLKGASAPIGALRLMEAPMDGAGIFDALGQGWGSITPPAGGGAADGGRPLVAVGGTATTLGAIHLMMKEYDPEALLGLKISKAQVEAVVEMVDNMTAAERLRLPGMTPGREDVLPWGLRILLASMDYCECGSVRICDRDLLYGVFYD